VYCLELFFGLIESESPNDKCQDDRNNHNVNHAKSTHLYLPPRKVAGERCDHSTAHEKARHEGRALDD
jgi:hypothetical protein